ncbi:MAG: hypothetical protein O6850_02070 [Acidobacteria bacterium]|nr:hypothetical protein [Acidobacteriota bacterium]
MRVRRRRRALGVRREIALEEYRVRQAIRQTAMVFAGLVWLVSCGGGGSRAYKAGMKSEAVRDFDTALANYSEAARAKPRNAQFMASRARMRSEASLLHLKRGNEFTEQDRWEEALAEYQRAAAIDASNLAARQGVDRMARAIQAAREAEDAARRAAEEKQDAEAAKAFPGVLLKPFPEKPLKRFRISAESRDLFQALGKLAGLNVAFTPDFQTRRLQLDLLDVTVEEALGILALQTKTFWKPVTHNTIVVIPDTARNRRDHEEQAFKIIRLKNPGRPEKLAAMVSTIKSMLNLRQVVENAESNAIIVRAPPNMIQAAEKIIRDLDRGRAEVLVSIIILEADRTRMRDLGLLPSQTFQIFATQGTKPLNELGSISTRDYTVTLPGAVAAVLMADSKTRILQNPEIRSTEGETASLKIGSSFPFATGSFQPGALTGGLQPLVSTQFQYKDVGVNIDLTPTVLPQGDISLTLLVEISSLQTTIDLGGGLTQPIFGQRRIEHTIRLREGEATLLGGLVERNQTITVGGWPGLSKIPGLRYLFSAERKETVETEVVILLRPRIVRTADGGGGDRPAFSIGSGLGADVPIQSPQSRRPAATPQRPATNR